MTLYIDDFLTRRYWQGEGEHEHGLGREIPWDYKEMTVGEELNALKAVKAIGVDFTVFIIGHVLELAQKDKEIREALQWLVDNNIRMAGHGYYHTEQEWRDGYVPWAQLALDQLKLWQDPPFLWRYPRHEVVNEEYIRGLGFTILGEKMQGYRLDGKPIPASTCVDKYLDRELLGKKSLEVLLGHEGVNAMVHSVHLTRVVNCLYARKQVEGHKLSEQYFDSTSYSELAGYLRSKVPKGRVLDVGCNTGYESVLLKKGGCDVVGIDIGEEFVEEAKHRGVDARVMNFHRLAFDDGEFDCVYWNNGPEHSNDPKTAFREMYRVLKQGGTMVVCLPSDYLHPDYKDDNWDSSLHVWKPNLIEICLLLERTGFNMIEWGELNAKKIFGLENKSSGDAYMVVVCQK